MKINGQSTKDNAIFPAPGKPLTFKRGEGFIAFYAQPVWDMNEFDALLPPPENRKYRFTKNGKEKDPNAPEYQEALAAYRRARWGYVVLKSLEPSKELGVEWETCSLDDPKTWGNVEAELKSALGLYEFAKVMDLVDEANAIDADKLEANAASFFARQLVEDGLKNSQTVEPGNSSSTGRV
jgi:hypothetical protein